MTTEIKFPPAPEPIEVWSDGAESDPLFIGYNLDQLHAYAGPIIEQRDELLAVLELIADPRNTHFVSDAQVVARAALAKIQDLPAILQPQAPL